MKPGDQRTENALRAGAPALAMLLAAYTFNFIDRQIMGILVGPIQAELGLNDWQMGLLGGLAFSIFYTGLGLPVAWAADRYDRSWIITIALATWSLFTALCGMAANFWQLFLARVGVGVGEAGGVAPSYALISDLFPAEVRGRAMAVFSFGIPLGSALGTLFGGLIAHAIDWRWSFIIVGLAGVALAPAFKAVVRDPARQGLTFLSRASPPADAPRTLAVLAALRGKASFWLLSFGAGAGSMVGYGMIFWLPSFFERSYGLALVDRSVFYAGIILLGGIVGIWMGGALGDRFAQRSKAAYAIVPALALLLTGPLYALAIQAPDPALGFLLFVAPQALSLMWIGPVLAAVQGLVEPRGRAVASALFLFIVNLIGFGLGAVIIGGMSEALHARFGSESLRYAILASLVFYLLAALLLALAARALPRDWRA